MAFTDGHDQVYFVDSTSQGAFSAPYVGNQYRIHYTWTAGNTMHDGFGIAQCGDCFGRGERGDLDFGVAAGTKPIDQVDLGVCFDEPGFILKPVAGGDFLYI